MDRGYDSEEINELIPPARIIKNSSGNGRLKTKFTG